MGKHRCQPAGIGVGRDDDVGVAGDDRYRHADLSVILLLFRQKVVDRGKILAVANERIGPQQQFRCRPFYIIWHRLLRRECAAHRRSQQQFPQGIKKCPGKKRPEHRGVGDACTLRQQSRNDIVVPGDAGRTRISERCKQDKAGDALLVSERITQGDGCGPRMSNNHGLAYSELFQSFVNKLRLAQRRCIGHPIRPIAPSVPGPVDQHHVILGRQGRGESEPHVLQIRARTVQQNNDGLVTFAQRDEMQPAALNVHKLPRGLMSGFDRANAGPLRERRGTQRAKDDGQNQKRLPQGFHACARLFRFAFHHRPFAMNDSSNIPKVSGLQTLYDGHGADLLALAVVISLPWSLSAALFLIVLWLIAASMRLNLSAISREVSTFAGAAPIILFMLGALGMLWANIGWAERLGGLDSFLKLLAIPLLLAQFRRSDRAIWLLIGFLGSCTALLAYFATAAIWQTFQFYGSSVKSATTEAVEFIICIFILSFLAIDTFLDKRWRSALGLLALASAFLAAILYALLVPSHWFIFALETLFSIFILALLLAWRRFGLAVAIGLLVASALICALLYGASAGLRAHVNVIDLFGPSRPVFWSKSLGFIGSAPWFGHGTGAIGSLFAQSARGQAGTLAEMTTNPFQETLFIGIQLGCVGIVALWAMWIAHLRLFRGHSLADWIGLMVTVSAITCGLFDSDLFDARRGWIYVFGVGVAGGVVLQKRRAEMTRKLPAECGDRTAS